MSRRWPKDADGNAIAPFCEMEGTGRAQHRYLALHPMRPERRPRWGRFSLIAMDLEEHEVVMVDPDLMRVTRPTRRHGRR